jgi:hypothetical protein
MTALSIMRPGAWRLRSGVLAFTLALFVPLAIPVAASASSVPNIPESNYVFGPNGNEEIVSNVSASSPAQGNNVFNVKFVLGVAVAPSITAVEHADATAQCSSCSAIAIGFQVVTTTLAYFNTTQFHTDTDALATDGACAPGCTAVADAYQVVVATDTSAASNFQELLSPAQLQTLYNVRSQILALPNSGLTVSEIQAKCQTLVSQVESIFEDASSGGLFSVPSFSPSVHGVGLAGGDQPVVKLYKDLQVTP